MSLVWTLKVCFKNQLLGLAKVKWEGGIIKVKLNYLFLGRWELCHDIEVFHIIKVGLNIVYFDHV